MNNDELSPKDYQIILYKAMLLLSLAWGGFLLALAGFFYASIAWTAVILTAILMILKEISLGVRLKISRELFFASFAFLLVAIVFSFFSEPSVFTGRDQGSFSEAAVRLAQNHQLEFSTPTSNEFFKLHESGRALNFPGFYYTNSGTLITQFSLVYISWLALFFALFGITGFLIANCILLFSFFVVFYLSLRLFMKMSSAIPIMSLAITSFAFMWFSKFTLSENMALPIIWLTILSLMLFLKNLRRLYYFAFLASLFLFSFTRIEGLMILVSSIIVFAFNKDAVSFIKNKPLTRFFLPAIFLLATFLANVYVDVYFYKEIIKALLPTIVLPQAKYLGEITHNILPNFYTLKIFYLYGLLGFFIVGAIGTILSLYKKEFYRLIPFFIILPTYVYFLDSQITPDHPWMLRRFSFSLLPVTIFYTGLLLGKWLETKQEIKNAKVYRASAAIVITSLLAMNMPSFLKYLTYIENKNLLSETQALSSKFSSGDLILIDQQASGDGWSMLAGPMSHLYEKNAVYFFNNQDLAKLDTSAFSNVYIVASNQQVPFYLNSTIGDKLTVSSDYKLETTRLNIQKANTLEKTNLPKKQNVTISGKILKFDKTSQ